MKTLPTREFSLPFFFTKAFWLRFWIPSSRRTAFLLLQRNLPQMRVLILKLWPRRQMTGHTMVPPHHLPDVALPSLASMVAHINITTGHGYLTTARSYEAITSSLAHLNEPSCLMHHRSKGSRISPFYHPAHFLLSPSSLYLSHSSSSLPPSSPVSLYFPTMS